MLEMVEREALNGIHEQNTIDPTPSTFEAGWSSSTALV
jgi:hypothetical protein